jgi:ligand-binding SRPBCC domain-containing protein
MAHFTYRFTVPAPAAAVRDFHHDPSILTRLSPPPIFVRLRKVEPLGEGSLADLVMWFGPIPVRWQAVHSAVGPGGFTDEQRQGPLRAWRHTHRFIAIDDDHTLVEETIDYEHQPGWRGWLTRLVFNRVGLTALFTYRKLVTQLSLQPRAALPWVPAGLAAAIAGAALLLRRQRGR